MQRELGTTGLKFYPIGLGAMPLSIANRPSETQACEVIKTFIDGGGSFIDTANVYCLDDTDIGHNERLITQALNRLGKTQDIFVATKGGLRRPKGSWTVDGDPSFIRTSCEQSLQSLETEQIALYQLHAVDPKVPFSETLGELAKLKAEGKIAHVGLSNVNLSQLQTALQYIPVVSVQNRCHVFHKQDFHNGVMEFCAQHAITYLAHSPVGGHYGHVRLPTEPLLQRLTHKYQTSVYGIALAWLLHQGHQILPIPGASKPASIRDSLHAPAIKLEAEDIETLQRLPDAG